MLMRISLCYTAGIVGGLANSVFVWLSGHLGLSAALGIAIAPDLTGTWLYPRLAWGGLWGLPFVFAKIRPSWRTGVLISIAPSLVQLIVLFPAEPAAGLLGLGLGVLTPVFVSVANAVWSATAVWWLRALSAEHDGPLVEATRADLATFDVPMRNRGFR